MSTSLTKLLLPCPEITVPGIPGNSRSAYPLFVLKLPAPVGAVTLKFTVPACGPVPFNTKKPLSVFVRRAEFLFVQIPARTCSATLMRVGIVTVP